MVLFDFPKAPNRILREFQMQAEDSKFGAPIAPKCLRLVISSGKVQRVLLSEVCRIVFDKISETIFSYF